MMCFIMFMCPKTFKKLNKVNQKTTSINMINMIKEKSPDICYDLNTYTVYMDTNFYLIWLNIVIENI